MSKSKWVALLLRSADLDLRRWPWPWVDSVLGVKHRGSGWSWHRPAFNTPASLAPSWVWIQGRCALPPSVD